jgi:glucose/arabinose dehydrogenase
MVITIASLALFAFFISLAIAGVALLRRPGRRILGGVLLLQALALAAIQIVLSTFPFGIGEPLIRVSFWSVLAQTAISLIALALAGALVLLGGRWLLGRLQRMRRPAAATVALLLALPLAASGAMYGMARASLPERERERDPLKRQVTLPPGFEWSIYAQGTIDNPTAITFGSDNKLYIADISGTLWVGSDANNDATIDTITAWASGFDLLVGIVWHDDELFAASSGKIEALRDSDGDGAADQRRLVVGNLPSLVFRPHSNNGMTFGPDGRLYFGVGSTTDGQFEQNPLAASILSVKPDGSDLKVFARGLGNSFDVAFNSDGELFAGDNGPSAFNGEDPPDEFNHIVEGGHYGFPYYFGDPPKNGGTRGALVSFPPHSVPTGLSFYTGDTYPAEYSDSGFMTLWQRGDIVRLEVARATNGNYLSRSTTFGSGFLYPIDVITGPDGNLYVADFGTSVIYRITYDPNKA